LKEVVRDEPDECACDEHWLASKLSFEARSKNDERGVDAI
jgi:hypothetical protein